MSTIKELYCDKLNVKIFETRKTMGEIAAQDAGNKLKELLAEKEEVNVVFAAAPSQNEFIEALIQTPNIEWERVNAFHMDEYIGLPDDAPQGFGNFLKERIFEKLPFKTVNCIKGSADDPKSECTRYTELLKNNPVDIVCMGIGENGHIAFNDPHVAFFNDKEWVKIVELDEKCRMQQVNNRCFKSIDKVPTHALTLTIPVLIKPTYIFCMVPGPTKANAVFNTVRGPIHEQCPASILRTQDNAILYTDVDSAKSILIRKAVITDEISQDFEKAVQLAVKYNLEAVEIRSVWDKGPHELDASDIEKIKTVLSENNLKVCGISAPIFKCDMDNEEEVKEHYEILNKSIKLAKDLDTNLIRGFTFWKKGDLDTNLDKIVSLVKRAVDVVEKEDIILALEFDPQVSATNAKGLAKVIEAVNSPCIKALWDPGNDIYDPDREVPYPDGYEIIKKHMIHMHLKDAILNEKGKAEGVAIGEGDVDYIGHFKQLLKDGYDGYVVLETHYRPKHEIKEDLMKLPKGSAFSYMGHEATEECLIKWEALMEKVLK